MAEKSPSTQNATTSEVNINDERAIRAAKRQALIDAGVNPYPIESRVEAHAADLKERYADLESGATSEDTTCVAGRIRAVRKQGKVRFLVLEDMSDSIQLFCKIDAMDEASWELLKSIDMGDIVQAEGHVMRTRRGELSVAPTHLVMLAKSCRPLPEKFHGLTDREMRYRQRYVDLIMNPEVKDVFRKRSQIVSLIRRFMEAQGYLEVETPMMHLIKGGANAKPFVTHFNALGSDFYLRIATELPLKRLIVGGMERVFEIGRQFRNEGMDLTHNPEFTTMEAYCAYSDLAGMKKLTEDMFKTIAREVCGCEPGHEVIEYQGAQVDMSGTWTSIALSDVVSQVIGEHVDMDTPIEHLRELLDKYGLDWQPAWGAGKLIFELYDELGEKTLVNPTFVCDYPEEVSPLSKRKADDPRLTDRFELVICGHEYANAFSELNDPVDQAERFRNQVAEHDSGDDEAMEFDADYIRALEYGMPPAGGIGYGIDRLVMLFCNQASIRDVLLFPQMKPEGGSRSGASATRAAEASESAQINKLPTLDYSKVAVEPLFEDMVDFDTFSKSDFRAVKVKECVAVPKSKKLLQFTLDDGTGADRTILSGIHAYYEPEDLVGKTLIAIVNLPPRKMMGIASCGMIISAVHEEAGEERLNLLIVDDAIPAGAKLY